MVVLLVLATVSNGVSHFSGREAVFTERAVLDQWNRIRYLANHISIVYRSDKGILWN